MRIKTWTAIAGIACLLVAAPALAGKSGLSISSDEGKIPSDAERRIEMIDGIPSKVLIDADGNRTVLERSEKLEFTASSIIVEKPADGELSIQTEVQPEGVVTRFTSENQCLTVRTPHGVEPPAVRSTGRVSLTGDEEYIIDTDRPLGCTTYLDVRWSNFPIAGCLDSCLPQQDCICTECNWGGGRHYGRWSECRPANGGDDPAHIVDCGSEPDQSTLCVCWTHRQRMY